MIRRNTNIINESNTKENKPNDNEEANTFARENGESLELTEERSNTKANNKDDELVAPEIDEQSPEIYKIPVEIMMEIFNSLRLEDLDSVYQTSKWWQKVASVCYQQNYSFIFPSYQNQMLKIQSNDKYDAFKQLITRIHFHTLERSLQQFLDTETEFHQLREIKLSSLDLTKIKIECLKPILNKQE